VPLDHSLEGPMTRLSDRRTAGRALADRLRSFAGRRDVTVLALPRGGVPVAYEIATALDAPLDVIVVRKLGVPGYPELAMGAIAGGKVTVLNRSLLRELRVDQASFDRVLDDERAELRRRELAYRGERPPAHVAGRIVIVVDDGLATGATMQAAITALEQQHASTILVAVPVASREAVETFTSAGHAVVTLMTPEPFYGVGRWYEDFEPTSDEEVVALLDDATRRAHAGTG
jgi:predicted phosphoribosyltransferase